MDNIDITEDSYNNNVIDIVDVSANVNINVTVDSTLYTSMFYKRITGDGIKILNNKALLKGISGNSLVYSQRVPDDLTPYRVGTSYSITYIDDYCEIYGFNITESANYWQIRFGVSRVEGHKYYTGLQAYANTDSTQTYARFGVGWVTQTGTAVGGSNYNNAHDKNKWITIHNITTPTGTSQYNISFCIYNAASGTSRWMTENTTIRIKNFRIVDLTRMFGAGNEPTVAEFEKLFPIGQYNYTSGIVLNNSMTNYISKDSEETTLQNVSLNVPTLTGKLNGEGESTIVFPNGLKSTVCLPSVTPTCLYKSDSKASYFDLDYVPTGQDVTIKCKIAVSSWISTASNLRIFGAYPYGENRFRVLRSSNTELTILAQNGANDYGRNLRLPGFGTDTTIELAFGSFTINETTSTLPTTIGEENTGSLRLFEGCNGKIYYFQVYKGEDLIVDCIPFRNGDVAGLYDRARDRVFTLIQASGEGTMSDYEPTYEELPDTIYDEIKQENGVWKAYKRISDLRVTNTANTGRTEYAPLTQEEVYILDDQTIPTELTVANQGTEEILPTNGATPTTAPAIMEIQYGGYNE